MQLILLTVYAHEQQIYRSSGLYFVVIAVNVDHRYYEHHQPTRLGPKNKLSSVMSQITEENKEETLDKVALTEYSGQDGQYDDSLCNVFRSGINNKCKISTYGFLATFLSCSIMVGFTGQLVQKEVSKEKIEFQLNINELLVFNNKN